MEKKKKKKKIIFQKKKKKKKKKLTKRILTNKILTKKILKEISFLSNSYRIMERLKGKNTVTTMLIRSTSLKDSEIFIVKEQKTK